jgi:hypothetical protein
MPKEKTRKAKTTSELTQELTEVKAELETLRADCTRMNRTLLRLCCPKEWFEEEIDDADLWSNGVWEPALSEIIDGLR